ncbi:protoporphyrinogen oxidase [Niveomyces insectorum RCEF 264]|uniref:Protoporphyrinogen oxidase n=1 Tax=Niveomyces insectorum RCEF 264 TaxID=1081102 RepID=A0A167TWA3_9HYPO|nr:protoporphyrinogen oxidase [Niveomyces insectorum RCEF 264]
MAGPDGLVAAHCVPGHGLSFSTRLLPPPPHVLYRRCVIIAPAAAAERGRPGRRPDRPRHGVLPGRAAAALRPRHAVREQRPARRLDRQQNGGAPAVGWRPPGGGRGRLRRAVVSQRASARYDDLVLLALLDELDLVHALRVGRTRAAHAAARASPAHLPPDESVGAFFLRRLEGDRRLVDNLASAVVHGIYGGDVWRLSVASSPFRSLWLRETLVPLVPQLLAEAEQQQVRQPSNEKRYDGHSQRPPGGGLRGYTFMQASDVGLLRDLTLRAREREQQEYWDSSGNGHDNRSSSSRPFAVLPRFVRLALASPSWAQIGLAHGFGTLTDALAARLRQQPNVTIRTSTPVTRIRYDDAKDKEGSGSGTVTVATATDANAYDRVVSTLVSPTLYKLTAAAGATTNPVEDDALPALRNEHAVTIQVVNLHYAEPHLNRPYHGFGYLVPQSVPLAENPEAALGVLFDTDRVRGLRPWRDVFSEEDEATTTTTTTTTSTETDKETDTETETDADQDASAADPPGTTFTVLLGGHYWDQYTDADYPTPAQAVAMAEAVVRRHLGTLPPDAAPVATHTKLCRQCIPQHDVGHFARMTAVADDLQRAFRGRLTVVGSSFTATGPGVLPSIRAARDVALRVAGRGYRQASVSADADAPGSEAESAMDHVGDTGLGRFSDPATDAVVPVKQRTTPLRFDNPTAYNSETGDWVVPEARR